MTSDLLPDELGKLKYPSGICPISVRATYLNRRQLERHRALLGRMPARIKAMTREPTKP